MLKSILFLALGGSFGAMARWGVHRWVDGRFAPAEGDTGFPWGILAVNVAGCFLFGWLFSLFDARSWGNESLRLAVFTGFLGSFTTFSTFGWNTLELLRSGQTGLALGNVAASVFLGLTAVWAGFSLGR